MGSTRRVVITGAATLVVAAITALAFTGGSSGTDSGAERAFSPEAPASPAETPTTVAAPEPDVVAPEPAPASPPRPAVAPVAPARVGDPAPQAPAPPAEVPIPRNPVPLADRTGPSVSSIEMAGCTIHADVSDPAGVAVVTLSWSGVAEPNFPDEWIVEPGSSRMHLLDGVVYQGSRPHPYFGQVYTVTAVDRTLVGNRSSASMTWNFHGYPC